MGAPRTPTKSNNALKGLITLSLLCTRGGIIGGLLMVYHTEIMRYGEGSRQGITPANLADSVYFRA